MQLVQDNIGIPHFPDSWWHWVRGAENTPGFRRGGVPSSAGKAHLVLAVFTSGAGFSVRLSLDWRLSQWIPAGHGYAPSRGSQGLVNVGYSIYWLESMNSQYNAFGAFHLLNPNMPACQQGVTSAAAPLHLSTMSRPQNVGILATEVYFPASYVSINRDSHQYEMVTRWHIGLHFKQQASFVILQFYLLFLI
jgi:hypothetical protein